jgi:glycosyltransferase involved in cell wall biosynthesis
MTANSRIAWLSPYGPRSDVGAFTRCLLPHFADTEESGFDCDLFVNPVGTTYDSPVPMMDIPMDGRMGEMLTRYDAAVFNLGNNILNHGRIAEGLRYTSGVAILHDFSYHHYFADKCFEQYRSPAAYARLIREYYGTDGFQMALRSGIITRDATLYAPWDGDNVAEYPLMQPLAMLAAAVIVHSRFMEEKVAKFYKGPILRLFLPSDQKVAPSEESIARWRSETANRDRCQFATFGHIGRPKCLDAIVQAFAQSAALRAKAHLVIAGYPTDKEHTREIETMVANLGLTKQVTFELAVTNERLLAIKNESDVFVNLRYPNTEGASGSLIEMLNTGRPLIAYRAGCYAEIPEDAGILIEREEGIPALVAAMEDLLASPERRIALGAAARRYLKEQDSRRYVRLLREFLAEHRDDLRRRSRFVTPVRERLAWHAHDVSPADAEWFADLTRARRSMALLETDSEALSPEMFLTWPMDDLISLVSRVLLDAVAPANLAAILVDYAQRLGRWKFYRLISTIRMHEALCQHRDLSKADLSTFSARKTDVAFWEIASRLQPEVFVRLLYLCVLERSWAGDEPASWVDRIRRGMAPGAVLLEFAESSEYRHAFADNLMADVENWARREMALSTSRRAGNRAQVVWPTDTTIHFGQDDPVTEALLGQLWHRRDAQGRWSNGRTGDLRFNLPEAAAKHGATLSVKIRVAGTRFTGQRRIAAQCNQTELGSVMLSDDMPLTWEIPLPASVHSKDGLNMLLICDQDYTPAASGQSGDKRALGVMLIEGLLTVAAPESGAIAKAAREQPPGGPLGKTGTG